MLSQIQLCELRCSRANERNGGRISSFRFMKEGKDHGSIPATLRNTQWRIAEVRYVA